jgi:monoamine oxidase
MSMPGTRFAIVGGGMSGLYAAYRLEQQGCTDYVLLEAREVPGGRILSTGRFDLGPTWFWPDLQPGLDRLVRELGLERFAQHESGDMMAERSRSEGPLRMRGYVNAPASMRLAGGMAALTEALRARLEASRIVTGQAVRRLRRQGTLVELDSEDAAGSITTRQAGHVLLAAPPRLLAATLAFEPALPDALARAWQATPTWMAPHAKYLAVYDTPFWRELGLSGEARSAVGPLGEIHDACAPGGGAALFGFFALPAQVRGRFSEEELRGHCRAQLARLFGAQAATPQADFIKDWAVDEYTATAADLDGMGGHAAAPEAVAGAGPWAGCMTGIGSEWSPVFPGYLAGAIDAVDRALQPATAAAPSQVASARSIKPVT